MFTSTITIEGRLAETPNALDNLTEVIVLTNRRGQDEAGEWVNTDTTRYTVKAFKTLAEKARDLHAGEKVLIVGSIVTNTWTDKDNGGNRYKPVILADAIARSL